MEVIHVPAVPKESFNKHRNMSDLIKAQVKHFKHLEEKLTAEERQQIPQHRITTENDAAQYIAAMTRLLRSGASGSEQAKTAQKPGRRKAETPGEGLALAAAAAETKQKPRAKSAPKKRRK